MCYYDPYNRTPFCNSDECQNKLRKMQHDMFILKSAAPDLLKALEGLYNHTKNNHNIFGLNAAAKEAIGKAKGVK